MPETSGLTLEQIENIWQSEKEPGCVVRRDPGDELHRLSTAALAPAVGLTRAVTTRGASWRRSMRSRRRKTTAAATARQLQEEEEGRLGRRESEEGEEDGKDRRRKRRKHWSISLTMMPTGSLHVFAVKGSQGAS